MSLSHLFVGMIALCLAVFAAKNTKAAAQAGAAAQPQGENEAVVMDRLIINAAKYNWQYATSPTFEILSDAESTAPAGNVATDAELMMTAFKKACPVFETCRDLPVQFIYCKGAGLGRFFKSVKEKYGQIDGGFVGARQNNEQAVIAMIAGTQIEEKRRTTDTSHDDEIRIILNLYLKACVLRHGADPTNAPWLHVALDRISRYATLDFDVLALSRRSKILEERAYKMCVDINDASARPSDSPSLSLMEVFNYIPPKLVFTGNMPDYIFNDDLTRGSVNRVTELTQADTWRFYTWANESADFIIYCLFGPDKQLGESLERFIKNAGKKPVTEEFFAECFEKSSQQFHNEMYKFLKQKVEMRDNGSYSYTVRGTAWGPDTIIACHFRKKDMPPKIKFRSAQRSETARVISDWFRLGGDQEVARRTLVLAAGDSPQVCSDPRFAATFGMSELYFGDEPRGVSLLEQAAAAKIQRPQVYRALAAMRFDTILRAKGKNYRLANGEADEIWTLLLTAHTQPQPSPQTYLLMSQLVAFSATRPDNARLKSFAEGCRLFPENINLQEKAVAALVDVGANAEAASLIQDCMQSVRDEAAKTRLGVLAEGLQSNK